MAYVVTCPPAGCKELVNTSCVFYHGPNLLTTNIKTNDSVEVVVQKLDEFLEENLGNPAEQSLSLLTKNVTQFNHGLNVGDAIRSDVSGDWVKAQADKIDNAKVLAIVKDVFDTNNFTYQWGGIIPGPWEPGKSYYLSPDQPGLIGTEFELSGTDVKVYIGTGTVEGLLIEIDLPDFEDTYEFEQNSASIEWTIIHPLNKFPSVTIVDSAGSTVRGEIKFIDKKTLTITFNAAFTGKAFLN